jgi:hypothetical protein
MDISAPAEDMTVLQTLPAYYTYLKDGDAIFFVPMMVSVLSGTNASNNVVDRPRRQCYTSRALRPPYGPRRKGRTVSLRIGTGGAMRGDIVFDVGIALDDISTARGALQPELG